MSDDESVGSVPAAETPESDASAPSESEGGDSSAPAPEADAPEAAPEDFHIVTAAPDEHRLYFIRQEYGSTFANNWVGNIA